MKDRRPTNSELRLSQLDEEESLRDKEEGILELFSDPKPVLDEDAPLERDPGQ